MTAPKIRASKNVVYWLHDDKKICATTQRTGSASMAEAFGPAGTKPVQRISMGDARRRIIEQDMDCILWIREPFERMVCAYDIWSQAHTPEEFGEKVLREHNVHWSPVSDIHRIAGHFLPTKIYVFDDVNETFPEEFGYALPHKGARERMQTAEFMTGLTPETHNSLAELFRQDTLLYEMAKANPGMLFLEVAA